MAFPGALLIWGSIALGPAPVEIDDLRTFTVWSNVAEFLEPSVWALA